MSDWVVNVPPDAAAFKVHAWRQVIYIYSVGVYANQAPGMRLAHVPDEIKTLQLPPGCHESKKAVSQKSTEAKESLFKSLQSPHVVSI